MWTLFSKVLHTFWYILVFVIATGVFRIYLPKIKGFFGEKSVASFLSTLNPAKYKVINNIMIQTSSRKTQIDHTVVSNYGIFVIETKNYQGLIFGNEFDDYWTQVIYKRREKLYNPTKQNYGHVQALKEVLGEYPDINYIPIVAFTMKSELKVKTSTDVIYTINLPKTIIKYNNETISDFVREQIYSKLLSLNIDSKENRKIHINNIRRNISNKNNRVYSNICPKCGGSLVVRKGKYGKFKGCDNFPKCRFIVK